MAESGGHNRILGRIAFVEPTTCAVLVKVPYHNVLTPSKAKEI
jgi:hypothetical protein